MATDTAESRARQASGARPARPVERRASTYPLQGREVFWLAATLALAAALRLMLAARGWPYSNSDEANTGLMGIDITWHGALPAFTYGIHHVGALDAYLQVPFFLALGPTNFAMHVTTGVLMLLFLLVFYQFVRLVYSPLVASVTTLLLALGPYQALFYGLRAGHYAQDMLLLGALLLWFTVLRLRRPAQVWACWALDLGIGLVAGLALWGTILMLPFVLAAGLALGVEAAHSWWIKTSQRQAWNLCGQAAAAVGAALLGMLPLIISIITTHGALFTEARLASQGTMPAGPLGGLAALGQQFAGTLLIGLPLMLGSETACAHCALWPYPGSNLTFAQALPAALTGALFSLLALICWGLAAVPLLRSASYTFRQARRGPEAQQLFGYARYRARTWGRAMLVIGGGLTILLYLSTRSSYETPDTSIRYISSIYLCAPLVIDPLCRGARRLWRWMQMHLHPFAIVRPQFSAVLASGLLLAIFAVNIGGVAQAWQESSNTQHYGVPAGTRDTQLLAFLETHHATRFYTTWWVCYRLMFDAQEQVNCAVVDNNNAFAPGFNPHAAYAATATAAPHPAYVFDLTTTEAAKSVPQQVASRIAARDPRFLGYTSTTINGYLVFYYAGSGT
ncbi:MAG TPA: hypothetical protein VKT82_18550 [Ktedonobacterales bacterium]|nr:hypothetical protein [Ktedonobacterales bacterium]